MILCCSTPMVPGDTLTEKAELLRSWGYDAVGVFWPRDEWSPGVRDELVSLHERTGIRPVEFVLTDDIYGKAMSQDDALRAACRDMYREVTDLCAELGMVTEIEYEYGPQDPMPLFDPYQQMTPDQEREFLAFYTELLRRAEGSSGAVLLEPLNRYESRYLNSVADNLRMIEAVDHPNAGLLPDTFHMSIEERDVAESLRSAGPRIRHVHLGDSNRLLPGDGALDWPGIFGALRDVGYDGVVSLECSTNGDPHQTLPATAAALRELAQPA